MITDDEERERRAMAQLMMTPTSNGEAPLPRRLGTRSMLPGTWVGRQVSVDYTDSGGKSAVSRAVLADWCPFGVIVRSGTDRLIIAWERIVLIELADN